MAHNLEGDIEIPPLQTPLIEIVNLTKLIGEYFCVDGLLVIPLTGYLTL